jgi:DNA polymerase elongation subunit (family B)
VRGYEDGKPYKEVVPYQPYLFVHTDAESDYKTIHGRSVGKLDFSSMKEARNYIKRYKDVPNYQIFGFTNFEYVYIYDNFKKGLEYDSSLLNIVNMDIETDSKNGFPNIKEADKEITAITLAKKGQTISFGYFPYKNVNPNRIYIQCRDEKELLERFIQIWRTKKWMPDIITGWNIEFFDIPYIINRIRRILGKREADRLSPFGFIEDKVVRQKNGKEFTTYTISGCSIIDYYAAYKKFAMNERESYKLDYIAFVELGEKKLDYSQYGSLNALYEQNFELFMDYNIHDAVLIEKLEGKLHYIEQVISIAYVQRVNFENTLTTVKPWDVLVHNYLMDQKIVVPMFEADDDFDPIVGGYVKEPKPGLYRWVVCVDFTSLYPSLAMQYNISPDTFVKQLKQRPSVEEIFSGDITAFTEELIRRDVCMSANGCLFKRDKRGFIPSIMKEYFDERKATRKLEGVAKKAYEENKTDENQSLFLKYKNLQTAYKLINNSGYGAIANKYFRWFADYLAAAITESGQMTTQYVEIEVDKWLNRLFKTEGVSYVVYCDTDSAYITLDYLVQKLGITDKVKATEAVLKFTEKQLVPFIDKTCLDLANRLNAFEFKTSMKVEKVCDKVFFVRKKRYALNILFEEDIYFYDKPKLKVTGLETVRSSVPQKSRDALKHCFKLIFEDKQDELYEFVKDYENKFKQMKFDDIAKPSSVKGLLEYYDEKTLYRKGVPIHVRGSLVYNDWLQRNKLLDKYEQILDHDKIKHCYLKIANITHENVIAIKGDPPVELDIENFLDYDLQFDKTFMQPLNAVCNAIGWDSVKIATLDDLFD